MIAQDFFGVPIAKLERDVSEYDHAAAKSCYYRGYWATNAVVRLWVGSGGMVVTVAAWW